MTDQADQVKQVTQADQADQADPDVPTRRVHQVESRPRPGEGVAPLRAGDPRRLDGYEVLGRLGQGGQGTVFLGVARNGDQVALKVLLPDVLAEPGARDRIAAEVALARRVPSFCTARLLGARLDGDAPYLVTEYVPGRSLAEHVLREGPLDEDDLERLMVGTLTALVTIHRAGVVHHDLKPENILLGPDGPRVVDFGIALRTGTRDPQANADGVLGSAAFLAPERLDAGPATPASDLFGWAATMVHAATGASPFHAPTRTGIIRAVEHDRARLDGVPDVVRPLLATCLDKDPTQRPTAATALTTLLEALQPLATPGTAATTPGSGTPVWGTPGAPARSPAPVRRPAPRSSHPGTWRDAQTGQPLLPPPDLHRNTKRPSSGAGWVAFAIGLITLVLIIAGAGQSSRRRTTTETTGPWFTDIWKTSTGSSTGTSTETATETPTRTSGPVLPANWGDTVALTGEGVELVDTSTGTVALYSRTQAGRSEPSPVSSTTYRADASGRHAQVLDDDGSMVAEISSADGDRLATVRVSTPAGGSLGGPWWLAHEQGVLQVAVSRLELVVAAATGMSPSSGRDSVGRVAAWNMISGKPVVPEMTVTGLQGNLNVSPDGHWIAFRVRTAGRTSRYRLVSTEVAKSVDLPAECLGDLGFGSTDSSLYCQVKGAIRVLDVTGRTIRTLPGTTVPGHLVASDDGALIAQSDGGTAHVHVVDVHAGGLLLDKATSSGRPASALAFGPGNEQVAVLAGHQFDVMDVPASG